MQLHSGRGLVMDEFSWEVWAALLPRGLSSIGRLNQALLHGWQEGKPQKASLIMLLLEGNGHKTVALMNFYRDHDG